MCTIDFLAVRQWKLWHGRNTHCVRYRREKQSGQHRWGSSVLAFLLWLRRRRRI